MAEDRKTEPRILSEKIKFAGNFMRILGQKVLLSNGEETEWETPDSDYDVVAVVPVDDEGNVYLSKEWRAAYNRYVTMLPAGAFGKDEGEDNRAAHARRELMEEIGVDCKNIVKLGSFAGSARIRIMHHIYLATGLFESKLPEDENEIVEVVRMPIGEAIEKAKSGEMGTTDYTLLGLLLAREKLKS